jgi:NADH dehydrogenase
MPEKFAIVTGAFSYTGSYITRLLTSRGYRIRTLTGHPSRPNPFGEAVEAVPFNFDNPDALARNLVGAEVVFNTYWIRFPTGDMTFERAVRNVQELVNAAVRAGVPRIVHISITGASADSSLPYFRGKGILEDFLMNSGLTYAIVRPALMFGGDDILINNIAWLLRRFPIFTIPGDGKYRVQPVLVDELAELAVNAAQGRENVILDAAGPEIFTFNELVALIARTIHSRARIVHVSPDIQLLLAWIVGKLTGDVTLTRDEVRGLCADLLLSHSAPTAPTRLSEWLTRNADQIGKAYLSEVARRA